MGDTVDLTFRVGWMSQWFAAGHRIRVTVSCTGMPLFETGGSGTQDGTGPRVIHEVLHGGAQASHVLAPVIPADGAGRVDMSRGMVSELAAGVFPA